MANRSAVTKKEQAVLIADLRQKIADADRRYYQENAPVISDTEYDQLKAQLLKLEQENPSFKIKDSPTQKIGEKTTGRFKRQKHIFPMVSISNAYSIPEVFKFLEKFESNEKMIVEPKVDGAALSLYYEFGVLTKAVTRGDGEYGDDVTKNVKVMRTIPKLLEGVNIDFVEVRGEVFITMKDFDKINKRLEDDNETTYTNPRNLASGTLKNSDPNMCVENCLQFVAHGFNTLSHGIKTFEEFVEFCKKHNIPHVSAEVVTNKNITADYINNQFTAAKNKEYMADGLVIKVNDKAMCNLFGETSSIVRWAVAYKQPLENVTSTLKDVIWTVGRTGRITPNAVVDAISIGGVTITSASLHNPEIMKALKLTRGCKVVIERAGEVIPQVVKAIDGKEDTIDIPNKCPVCSSFTEWEGPNLFCRNQYCPAKQKEQILHFGGRDYMDIRGLGPSTVDTLLSEGLIKSETCLYKLETKYKKETEKCLGKKTAANLFEAINQSKTRGLAKVLASLGYPRMGRSVSKDLAFQYKTIENLISAVQYTDLLNLPGIGTLTAEAVFKHLNSASFMRKISELKEGGVLLEEPDMKKPEVKASKFTCKRVVITGTLSRPRGDIESDLASNGAIIQSSVSGNTDILIVGEKAGSKLDKAKKLGIEIWSEEQLQKELNNELSS